MDFKYIFKHKLFKNSLAYVLTNVINVSVPLLVLPILTRYLTPSDYGIVAIYQVIETIVFLIIGLNTHSAIMVNFYKISKEKLRIYIGNVFFILFITFIVALIISFIIGLFIESIFSFPTSWLPVVVIIALFQFVVLVNLTLWRAEQKARSYSIMQITSSLFNLGLSVYLVVAIGMKWQGRILSILITYIIFGIVNIYLLRRRGYLKLNYKPEYIRDALKVSVPLIPHSLSGWIDNAIDRVLVTAMVGISTTGLYSVGYQVGMLIGMLSTAFNKAWTPFLFQKLTENNPATKLKIVKFTYLYFAVILLMALVLSLLAPFLLSIFVGPQFQSANKYIVWVAFAYALTGMYFMVTNYIFYVKKTHILAWITFGSALLYIGANYVLISLNGAVGAAQATLLLHLLTFVGSWILSARVYKMPWNLKLPKLDNTDQLKDDFL